MMRYCFICIFLYGYFVSSGQENIPRDVLKSALYYERLAFEESDLSRKGFFLLQKSYIYKGIGDYQSALDILNRIKISSRDSLNGALKYEKILLNYLLGNYQRSFDELLKYRLSQGTSQEGVDNDILVLEILNLIGLNKWVEAKELALQNADHLSITSKQIQEVFSGKLKPKNPDKAYNLSLFLPGVGQMYSGHYLKGVLSGSIQVLLVGFSAYSLHQGYFFTGGMTGVALFYTFYLGGARNARELAMARNKEQARKMSSQLMKGIK
ncbi:MAG: hypothetical protein RIC30_13290 [Marinoscillum sp.]|uniref:hypothetical protein n=1 Tax=Marinoscillum sp. TaxID=2024838 RepID=UPI0032F18535